MSTWVAETIGGSTDKGQHAGGEETIRGRRRNGQGCGERPSSRRLSPDSISPDVASRTRVPDVDTSALRGGATQILRSLCPCSGFRHESSSRAGPVPVPPSAACPPATRPTHRDRSDVQAPCLAESTRLLDRPFYWICVLSLLRGESRRPGRPFLRGRRPVPRTRRLEARVRVLAACARACRAHHPAAPVPPPPRGRRR